MKNNKKGGGGGAVRKDNEWKATVRKCEKK